LVQFRIKREIFPLVALFRYRLTIERCVGTIVSYVGYTLVPIVLSNFPQSRGLLV